MRLYLALLTTFLLGCDPQVTPLGKTAASRISDAKGGVEANDLTHLSWSADSTNVSDVYFAWESSKRSFLVKACQDEACSLACTPEIAVEATQTSLTIGEEGRYYACVAEPPRKGSDALYSASRRSILVDFTPPLLQGPSRLDVYESIQLSPRASDASKMKYRWSQKRGEGTILFSSDLGLETIARASQDGLYTVTFEATDEAGNRSSLDMDLAFDRTRPEIRFSQPNLATVITPSNRSAFPVSGSCAPVGMAISIEVTAGSDRVQKQTTCLASPAGSFAETLDLSGLTSSSVDFAATAYLAVGRTARVEQVGIANYGQDTAAPVLAFTSTPDPIVRPLDPQILSFTASDAGSGLDTLSYSFAADGTSFGAEIPLDRSSSALTWTVPSLEPSATQARIRLRAIDKMGNVSTLSSSPFQIIRTVTPVLNGSYASAGGAEGIGAAARFTEPIALATDGTYIYIADEGYVLRRLNPSTGEVRFIAGRFGRTGSTDGKGDKALLGSIHGMTVLGSSLYFMDSSYYLLKKVDINPSSPDFGLVTTVAGSGSSGYSNGIGGSASFRGAMGITHDGTYLYVADSQSNIIRRVDPLNGNVTLLAGGPGSAAFVDNADPLVARFNNPRGIVHIAGILYISEYNNADIRRLNLSTGAVTSVSGTSRIMGALDGTASTGGFRGLTGLTTDGAYLYAADMPANAIRRVSLADGSISTFSGQLNLAGYQEGIGSGALYNGPRGVIELNGYLYVSDTANNLIRRIDIASGQSSQVAGAPLGATGFDPQISASVSNAAKFEQPKGVATDDGIIYYVADAGAHVIRKIDLNANTVVTIAGTTYRSGNVDGIGTAASFNVPWGLLKEGNYLYISEQSGHRIRRMDLTTGQVTRIVGTGTAGGTNNVTGTSATINSPLQMVSDGTFLYVAEFGGHRVRKIEIGGTWPVTTLAGSGANGGADGNGTAAQFSSPASIALWGGDLLVGDNHRIRKVSLTSPYPVTTLAGGPTAGGLVDGIGAAATFNTIRCLYRNGTKLYINDISNQAIRMMDLGSNAVTTLVGTTQSQSVDPALPAHGRLTKLASPGCIEGFGNKLLITSNPLKILDLTTGFSKHYGTSTTNAFPSQGVNSGSIQFQVTGDLFNHVKFQNPYLYLIDSVNGVIKRANADGTGLMTVAGQAGDPGYVDAIGTAARIGYVTGATTDPNYLYFSDLSANVIRRMSLTDFTVDTLAGSVGVVGAVDGPLNTASFHMPWGLVIVGDQLYVADRSNYLIRKVSLTPATLGEVVTVAGRAGISGTATGAFELATFHRPQGITAIGRTLFVADTGTGLIRQLNLDTRLVTSPLSNGAQIFKEGFGSAASLHQPWDIASDGSQNLYVSDFQGGLRKIYLRDLQLQSFLGNGNSARDQAVMTVLTDPFAKILSIAVVPGLGLYLSSGGNIKWVH